MNQNSYRELRGSGGFPRNTEITVPQSQFEIRNKFERNVTNIS